MGFWASEIIVLAKTLVPVCFISPGIPAAVFSQKGWELGEFNEILVCLWHWIMVISFWLPHRAPSLCTGQIWGKLDLWKWVRWPGFVSMISAWNEGRWTTSSVCLKVNTLGGGLSCITSQCLCLECMGQEKAQTQLSMSCCVLFIFLSSGPASHYYYSDFPEHQAPFLHLPLANFLAPAG